MNTLTERQTQSILLVEDNEEDYQTTVRAFKAANLVNEVFRCEGGDDALDYLLRRGAYVDPVKSPRPGIILLDLNMPGTDGREVLEEIKKDPELRQIPVVVLTTSSDKRDIEDCYAIGANSYVQKPVNLDGFLQSIQRLTEYWFEIALIPKTDDKA